MDERDHDILVRNTTMTEQMARQLNDALSQLVRGNERFANQDSRIERVEGRVARLEEQTVDGIARLRTDLLRAVAQSAELKRDMTEEAIAPVKADLRPIKEAMAHVRIVADRGLRILKWALGVGTALLITYLVSTWGLR